jgi:menaquinone-dependent protoporphyrinogen oxidase
MSVPGGVATVSRILIVYGTTDGYTAKVARFLAGELHGEAAEATSAPDPASYDGVIVAASVHIGDFQKSVRKWVAAHAASLAAKPSAFLAVCLGVLQPEPQVQRDLERIVERFLARTGWRPTETRLVAGAVLYTRYNWLKRWMMKRIAAKAGGSTDTSRDHEYTDWADLAQFAQSFARRASGVSSLP